MSCKIPQDVHPFVKLEDPSTLLPFLEQNLPHSALVYNSVKMHSKHKDFGSIYVLDGQIDESTWIVCTYFREDDGQGYHIFANKEQSKLSTDQAIQLISSCPLFQWDKRYFYSALQPWISDIVTQVCDTKKDQFTITLPFDMFYKKREDCLNVDIKSPDPSTVEIKPLDLDKGLDFLVTRNRNPAFKSRDTFAKFVERNVSVGVYVKGEPICALMTRNFGIVGSLYTDLGHRNKGYAFLAMQYAFKELAKDGLIPTTIVVHPNIPSTKLHEKLGCKHVGRVEYIEVLPEFVNKM